MARHLTWSSEAVEDIESIARYIERDSPWYAKAVVSSVVTSAESIPNYPEMGKWFRKSAIPQFANALFTATGSFTALIPRVF